MGALASAFLFEQLAKAQLLAGDGPGASRTLEKVLRAAAREFPDAFLAESLIRETSVTLARSGDPRAVCDWCSKEPNTELAAFILLHMADGILKKAGPPAEP